MKNKLLFWIIALFTLVNIADAFTALFILPGEANPLYLTFKSIYPVIALKSLVVGVVWWVYNKNTHNTEQGYFNFLAVIIIAIFLVSLGVASNIYGMTKEGYVQSTEEITNAEKITWYSQVVGIFYLMPWAFSVLIFWVYNKTKNNIIIDKNFMIPVRFRKYETNTSSNVGKTK